MVRCEFSMGELEEMFDALVAKANDEKVKLPSTNMEYYKGDTRILSVSTKKSDTDDVFECLTCLNKIRKLTFTIRKRLQL